LTQLDEAVGAFREENPTAEIIVVADATFEHRAATNERSRFNEAVLEGEIVTPPAGAVGRGDGFILKIADRIDAVVLSNDSFQEFQDDYPWLFEEGRLVGGKPVRGVGWVFTPRIPVRNVKVTRAAKKLALTLPNGAKPTIGTTLTPVKSAKRVASTKKAAVKPEKPIGRASTKPPTKPPTKVPKKLTKVVEAVKKPPTKKALAKVPVKSVKKVSKMPAPAPAPAPAVALRRGRQPVNPAAEFTLFKSTFRVGSRVPGEVTAFTSHGAVIKVQLKGGKQLECYAPTTLLGSPAPARARDVLARGNQRTFRLVNVDSDRRIAELALL
jgi:hypothetical protein